MRKRRSKYGARKCTIDGIEFASRKEGRRYQELKAMQERGEIQGLTLQQKFVLIPEYREESAEVFKRGANKGRRKPGKVIERECSYFADFVYRDKEGNYHVEDTKGMRTKEYIIKRKLMLHEYCIRIEEI